MKKKERQLKAFDKILQRFDDDRKIHDLNAYEGSAGGPWNGRLEAAAVDQIEDDVDAIPRYAIWAETVRGNLLSAEADITAGKSTNDALRKLRSSVNALSAFSEIQRIFDPCIAS
jgi:hypothetical protein